MILIGFCSRYVVTDSEATDFLVLVFVGKTNLLGTRSNTVRDMTASMCLI